MKKQRFLLMALLMVFLSGCSGADTITCAQCSDRVDRWISCSGSDAICATCFSDGGYLVCNQCGLAYDPDADNGEADGYCSSCAESETWHCAYCEEARSLDDLVQVDNGYYLCGNCLYWVTVPFDNAFTATYSDYESPLKLSEKFPDESRNDYLNIPGDWVPPSDESVFSQPEYYFADYAEGFDAGYSEGYEDGETAGYEEGFEKGRSSGKTEGYDNGYAKGYKDGKAVVGANSSNIVSSAAAANSGNQSTESEPVQSLTVYITETGTKYHRWGCQYLRKSCIPVSLADARSDGYTACSRCW